MLGKPLINRQSILWIYIILLSGMLCLRDVAGYDMSKYIFVIFILVISIASNYQTLLSVISFTLPLLCGLPGNYLLPVWTVLVIYHQYVNKTLNLLSVIFCLIILIWELIVCSLYPYDFSVMSYISYASSLCLMCMLVSEKGLFDYRMPIVCFCIGCCVLLAIIFTMYIKDPSLMFTEGGVRMGGDVYADEGKMVLRTNANNIGYLSVSAIACLLTLFYYRKIKLLPFIILVSAAFVFGMYSVSRTWAILVLVTLVLYLLFQRKNRILGFFMLSVFVLAFVVYFMNNELMLAAFVDRFTGYNIETGGERFTLFAEYNNFLFSHPLNFIFGTGAQLYKQVTEIYYSTHNGLQQIWLSYGVVGFALFMSAYVVLLKQNYVKGQFMACMPMLIVFMFIQTIQFLNPYSAMFPFIVAFLVMKMIKADTNKSGDSIL